MRSIIQPTSRADIERLYAGADAVHIELSSELVEHHIRKRPVTAALPRFS